MDYRDRQLSEAAEVVKQGDTHAAAQAAKYLLSRLFPESWGPPMKTWKPEGRPKATHCKYGHPTADPGSRYARGECATCQSNRAKVGHPAGSDNSPAEG